MIIVRKYSLTYRLKNPIIFLLLFDLKKVLRNEQKVNSLSCELLICEFRVAHGDYK